MKEAPDFRLDVLIKKEENYYLAHCLQFDLVATDDSIEAVQKAITDLCVSHIVFSIRHDNTYYLFQPAPQEVWAEYFTIMKDPSCIYFSKTLEIPIPEQETPTIPAFIIQEVLCNEQSSLGTAM